MGEVRLPNHDNPRRNLGKSGDPKKEISRGREQAPKVYGVGSATEASSHHPKRNEDAHYCSDKGIVVADGVTGGPDSQERASHLAAQAAVRVFRLAIDRLNSNASIADIDKIMNAAVAAADQEVQKIRENVAHATGIDVEAVSCHTTISAVVPCEEKGVRGVLVYSLGDSSVFIRKEGKLIRANVLQNTIFNGLSTEDAERLQNRLDEADNPRQLAKEASKNGKDLSSISGYLGDGKAFQRLTRAYHSLEGATEVIVASDGIEPLKVSELTNLLSLHLGKENINSVCRKIIQAANQVSNNRRKPDDRTVAIMSLVERKTDVGPVKTFFDRVRGAVSGFVTEKPTPAHGRAGNKVREQPSKASSEAKVGLPAVDPSIAEVMDVRELKFALNAVLRLDQSERARIVGVLNKIDSNERVSDEVIDGLPEPITGLRRKIMELQKLHFASKRQ